jgi:hypothetical protein
MRLGFSQVFARLGGAGLVLWAVFAWDRHPARESATCRVHHLRISDHAGAAAHLLEEGRATTLALGWRLIAMNHRKNRPNKAPEPTPTSVTLRASSRVIELKQMGADRHVARSAPDAVVAHL